MRICILLILFSVFAPLSAVSLPREEAVCTYYLRLQQTLGCKPSNYLKNTGYRLCRKYVEKNTEFSARGKVVMAKIRRCLTAHLQERERTLTCDNVEEAGFASHAGCYISSGYCELPLRDKWTVYRYGFRLMLNPNIWEQILEIQAGCAQRRGLDQP